MDKLNRLIFSIRWGLVPMYLTLWMPILGFCLWSVQEMWSFWFVLDPQHHVHLLLHDKDGFIIWALGMIDATMVASLVVIVAIGSYKTYIKDVDLTDIVGFPKWMNELDSSTLKIKTIQNIIGVTAVAILRMGMEYNKQINDTLKTTNPSPDTMIHLMQSNTIIQVVIHVIFVATVLAFTISHKWAHPPHAEHKETPAHH